MTVVYLMKASWRSMEAAWRQHGGSKGSLVADRAKKKYEIAESRV
jgi:hypothetical protein